jgi:hypothetical protein
MANAFEGTAEFEFSGKPYRLTLNNRVLMEAEDVLGYSALDAAEEAKAALAAGRNPMLRTVIALFYGALVQNHREVTQDQAIDMFMSDDPAAQDAFKAVLRGTEPPASVASKAGNAPAAATTPKTKRGAGKGSSRSGGARASRRKSSS